MISQKKMAQIFPSQKFTHNICPPPHHLHLSFQWYSWGNTWQNTKWWRSDRSHPTIQSHQRIKDKGSLWKELFVKFHWKNPFFLGIFFFTAFSRSLDLQSGTLNTERRHRMSWTKDMSISVSLCTSRKCFSNHAWITKPLQFRNQIKTISDHISYLPFFLPLCWHFLGLPGFSALTKCSPRVPGRHHCGSTAVPQQKRRPNARPRPERRKASPRPRPTKRSKPPNQIGSTNQRWLGFSKMPRGMLHKFMVSKPYKMVRILYDSTQPPIDELIIFTQALLDSHLLVVLIIQRICPFQSL